MLALILFLYCAVSYLANLSYGFLTIEPVHMLDKVVNGVDIALSPVTLPLKIVYRNVTES